MRQYLDTLSYVLANGHERMDRTGTGTRALFGLSMRFNMEDGFPAVTTKKLFFSGVRNELLWFLSGSRDVKELQQLGVHIWDENANAPYWKHKAQFDGDLGRIYGVQWRSWRSYNPKHETDPENELPYIEVDQIKNVIERIKQNPYDRRLIVSAWNPGEIDHMVLPPCHSFFQFFVAHEKLSLLMHQRSCDMFLGVPFNIASYSLLLHMIAQVTDLQPGEFIHSLGDVHVYLNHIEQIKTQLAREPHPLPQLWINPEISDIDAFTPDDIKLLNYTSHPTIKAPMAV